MCSPFPAKKKRRTKSRSGARPRKTAPFAILQGHMRHRVGLLSSPERRQNPAKTSAAARRSAPQRSEKVQVWRAVLHLSRPFSRAYTRARGRVCAGDQLCFLHRFFTMGFIRGFSRGKILSVQSEKFFQSRVKDSFTLREKFFQSQGKVFSVQSEKFFQSEPREKRADGLNRLLVVGNAAERGGKFVVKVQQGKGGHIIPPSRANTSTARL